MRRGSESLTRCSALSLSKTFYLHWYIQAPGKRSDITEQMLTGMYSIKSLGTSNKAKNSEISALVRILCILSFVGVKPCFEHVF